MASDNVSLAELRDGTRLIRVGEASTLEVIGWRYGKKLIRRRQQFAIRAAIVAAIGGAMLYFGAIPSLLAAAVIGAGVNVGGTVYSRRRCATMRIAERVLHLSRHSIAHVELRPNLDEGFEIRVPYLEPGRHDIATFELWARNWLSSSEYASVILVGHAAWPPARIILPILNSVGGTPADIAEAMTLIEMHRTPEELWTALAASKRSGFPALWGHERGGSATSIAAFRLRRLRLAQRLALEISIQSAVEDESQPNLMADIGEEWKKADVIAGIADRLLNDSTESEG